MQQLSKILFYLCGVATPIEGWGQTYMKAFI